MDRQVFACDLRRVVHAMIGSSSASIYIPLSVFFSFSLSLCIPLSLSRSSTSCHFIPVPLSSCFSASPNPLSPFTLPLLLSPSFSVPLYLCLFVFLCYSPSPSYSVCCCFSVPLPPCPYVSMFLCIPLSTGSTPYYVFLSICIPPLCLPLLLSPSLCFMSGPRSPSHSIRVSASQVLFTNVVGMYWGVLWFVCTWRYS